MSPRKTRTYTAELPWQTSMETIEALRGLGRVRLTFVIEGETREKVVRELANEFEWRGLGGYFWDRHLSGRRRRRDEVSS